MLKNATDFFTGAISIYIFIIIIRLVMSWFSPQSYDSKGLLSKMCDPYLNIFKKIRFFTIGYIDFSPIIAIAVLIVIGNILTQFGNAGTITFGIIVAIFIKAIWNAISTLLFFLVIIALIRIIIILARPNKYSTFLTSLDSIIAPMASRISSLFVKSNPSYLTSLVIFTISITVICIAGNFLINFLAQLAMTIPF